MGNNNNKLGRKFSSLPEQNFPSTNARANSSVLRKLARKAKRKQHEVTYHVKGTKNENRHVPFVDTLFLPEYPSKGDVSEREFEVVEVIAKGSFGNVVKVKRMKDRSIYAVKMMKKSQVLDENAVQQCKDEATIQSEVGHHPFIVKPYFYWQNRESLYIAMDYIPGGELFALWKRYTSFSEALVKIYTAELALVLDYLHQSGIVYRDLKMENVLIDGRGHLQVIDFGLAKWLKRGARTRTICGTLQYIAPEVLSMTPYGHPADWWSLGIMMYALLTGGYPVTGATNHFDMSSLVAQHVYDLPPHFSWEARDLIRKLLRKDPQDRIHSLRAFQRVDFFRNIDFDGIQQREVSPLYYLEKQGSFDFVESSSRSSSMDELDTTFNLGSITYTWNQSVASLDGMLV